MIINNIKPVHENEYKTVQESDNVIMTQTKIKYQNEESFDLLNEKKEKIGN